MPAALVTGATRRAGIAAAIAVALARDGWDVGTTGFRPYDATGLGSRPDEPDELVAQLRRLGVSAAFHEDDLGDPEAPARVLDSAEAAVGPLAGLLVVHTEFRRGGVLETTAADLDRHLAVNVRGALLLIAEFARRFRAEPGSGRVVTITSGAVHGEVAYGASKAALERITLAAAAELASKGITVNAVDPGPTDTGWMTPDLYERIRAETPLGRIGTPEDAANLVAFLCSSAGGWITGQILTSDGGLSAR